MRELKFLPQPLLSLKSWAPAAQGMGQARLTVGSGPPSSLSPAPQGCLRHLPRRALTSGEAPTPAPRQAGCPFPLSPPPRASPRRPPWVRVLKPDCSERSAPDPPLAKPPRLSTPTAFTAQAPSLSALASQGHPTLPPSPSLPSCGQTGVFRRRDRPPSPHCCPSPRAPHALRIKAKLASWLPRRDSPRWPRPPSATLPSPIA